MIRVLLVDEDDVIRKVRQFNLENEGFEMVTVQDPALVQSQIISQRPGVIIAELSMPNLDIGSLVAQTAEIPLIVVTLPGRELPKFETSSTGIVRYLTEPFSMDALVKLIREVGKEA